MVPIAYIVIQWNFSFMTWDFLVVLLRLTTEYALIVLENNYYEAESGAICHFKVSEPRNNSKFNIKTAKFIATFEIMRW